MDDSLQAAAPGQPSQRRSREERRRELVDAAMRAIRRGGRSLSMNELAAEAGITKPILYRHFGDRRGLVNAITLELYKTLVGLNPDQIKALHEARDDSVLETMIEPPNATPEGFRQFLRSLTEAFFTGAAREPELFRFVMQEDGFRNIATELQPARAPGSQLGHTLARHLRRVLEAQGKDVAEAEPLGQLLAGAVEGGVQWWSTAGRDDEREMIEQLSSFLWQGVRGRLE